MDFCNPSPFYLLEKLTYMIKYSDLLCIRGHNLRIAFIGDVVGFAGMNILRQILPGYLRDNAVDICIVNGENSAGGLGITTKIANELHKLGADVITLGNHTFSNPDILPSIEKLDFLVRPSNVSSDWPGNDVVTVIKNGIKVSVFNLLGQVSMMPSADNPFKNVDELLSKNDSLIKVVDFHAEATSEKQLMGFFLDGKTSLVVGTHTHVQTADNRVLPEGTGYISDAGMTGAVNSIIGMEIDTSSRRLIEKLPAKYSSANGESFMCGVLADFDQDGKCISVKRICEYA